MGHVSTAFNEEYCVLDCHDSWYAQHNLGDEALKCFKQTQVEGVSLDAVTYICIFKTRGVV